MLHIIHTFVGAHPNRRATLRVPDPEDVACNASAAAHNSFIKNPLLECAAASAQPIRR
jgi:hypothetical protein